MGEIKALFDTNILIDYLLGYQEAKKEIEQYDNPQISIITKMEVLAGASNNNESIERRFIEHFSIIALNEEVAEIAVAIRRVNHIKLPDAIIWASAKHTGSLLITRNTKDFPLQSPDIKVPYTVNF